LFSESEIDDIGMGTTLIVACAVCVVLSSNVTLTVNTPDPALLPVTDRFVLFTEAIPEALDWNENDTLLTKALGGEKINSG